MAFRTKSIYPRTRKRKYFNVNILDEESAEMIRKRFVETFLMTYDEYYEKSSEIFRTVVSREDYKKSSMMIFAKEEAQVYYTEAMKLVRKMGDEVYFMSESTLCPSCEGIRLNKEEKKGFVALGDPNALADQIIYEWRASYAPKEMLVPEDEKRMLPFNLYIFDKEFTKYVIVSDIMGIMIRPYSDEERMAYVYGFDKKLMKKYASLVKTGKVD